LIGIVISQTMIMLEVWEPFMAWFEKTTGIADFTVAWTLIFAGAMLLPVVLMLAASFVSSIIPRGTSNPNMVSDQAAELSVVSKDSTETTLSGFVRYGYALIPLGLGIHLAHNAKHFLGEGFFVIYTSVSLVGWNITGDLAILNMPTIQVIQYILSILGVLGAIYTTYKISLNNPNSKASILPYVILILMFGIIALWMYSIPMAARAH